MKKLMSVLTVFILAFTLLPINAQVSQATPNDQTTCTVEVSEDGVLNDEECISTADDATNQDAGSQEIADKLKDYFLANKLNCDTSVKEGFDGTYCGPLSGSGYEYITSDNKDDILNFITSFKVYEEGKEDEELGKLEVGKSYTFDIEAELPYWFAEQTVFITKDDTYTTSFKMPEHIDFKLPEKFSFVPIIMEDKEVARANILKKDENGNFKFVISFQDGIEQISVFKMQFSFTAQLNMDDDQPIGDSNIKLPFNGKDSVIIENTSKLEKEDSFLKSDGTTYDGDPSKILWTIDVNKREDDLPGLKLLEKVNNDQWLEEIRIYPVKRKANGDIVESSKVNYKSVKYDPTVPTASDTIDFKELFPDLPSTQSYYIEVISAFDYDDKWPETKEGNPVWFNNDATFTSENLSEDIKVSGKHHVTYLDRVVKKGEVVKGNNRLINWTVTYNQGEQKLGKPKLKDTLPKDLKLLDDKVTITDSSGKTLVEGVDYDLNLNGENNSFIIEFITEVNSKLTINYTTVVKDNVEIVGYPDYNNNITDGPFGDDYKVSVSQAFIEKHIRSVNRQTHTVKYELIVNSGLRPMYNPVIRDEFLQTGIKYQEDDLGDVLSTLKVQYNGKDMLPTEYTLETSVENGKAYFTITPHVTDENKGLFNGQFNITYEAKYDVKAFQSSEGYKELAPEYKNKFRNTATLEFNNINGDSFKSSVTRDFPIKDWEMSNGNKNGHYIVNKDQLAEKIISWEIHTNFNKNTLIDATLEDRLPAGLRINEESLKFYLYYVDKEGNVIVENEPLNKDDNEYISYKIVRKENPFYNGDEDDLENRDLLEVTYKKDGDYQVLIKFDTAIKGDLVKASYKNEAIFEDDGKKYPLDKVVSVPNGGSIVNKAGVLDRENEAITGILKWSLELNYSRSKIGNFEVTDTFTKNHILNFDSIKLFKTGVGTDGKLYPTGEEVPKEEYTLTEGDGTDFTFKLKFNKDIAEGYYLTYESIADLRNSDDTKFKNEVEVNGEITGKISVATGDDTYLDFSTGSGSGSVQLPHLRFKKLDQFGKPVKGAKFELTHRVYPQYVLEGTTESDGVLLFENVPKGDYDLAEVFVPKGYQMTPRPKDENGNDLPGYYISTSFGDSNVNNGEYIYNYKNTIRVIKSSSAGVKDLSDAEFELYRVIDGKVQDIPIDTKFTNGAGIIVFNGVDVGKDDDNEDYAPYVIDVGDEFVVKEKNPLPGHIKDINPIKIKIEEFDWSDYLEDGRPTEEKIDELLNSSDSFSFNAEVKNHKGKVYFHKVNADKENPLPIQGIGFKLENVDDKQHSYSATSDKDGLVEFENVSPGTYALYEVKNSTNDGVSQEKDYIRIENEITRVTIDADNSDKDNFYTEGAPKPIKLNNVLNFQGSVTLTKTDAVGKELAGATFELFMFKDGERKTTERTVTTSADGKVTFKDLKPGKYSIKEIQAPAGYVLDDRYFEFVIEESSPNGQIHKDLDKHANLKGSITLTKKDGHDNNILLSGAKFELYSAGENGTYLTYGITDKDGQVKFDQLAPGSYYVIESEAPEGYILNAAFKKEFEILGTLQEEQHIVETVNNYKGSIVVNKIDEHENVLEGAVFILKDANDRIRTAVVSPDKQIIFDQLEPGDYTLYEMVAPNGFIKELNSKTITIPESYDVDEPYIDVVDWINYKGEITITKQDALSKAPLEGVEYELTGPGYEDGEIFITDENGQISIENLAVGDYQLVEVTPLDGYVLNTEVYEFTIEATSSGKPERITKTFDNEKGSVKLTKYDYLGEVLEGVEFELFHGEDSLGTFTTNELGIIEVNDLAIGEYTFVETKTVDGHILNTKEFTFTVEAEVEGKVVQDPVKVDNYKQSVTFNKLDIEGNGLAGAEFKIYAIIDEVVAETATATAYSDDEGVVVFENLDVGEYIIRETKAAEGYYLNTKEVKVTINAEHEGEVPVLDSDDFINYKGSISFTKYDEYENALAGSVFELINEDNVVVDTQTSYDEGLVLFEEVAVGVYTVKEIEASTGYMINTTEVEVTVGYEAEELPETVVMEDFINYLGEVTFVKTDVNGDPLEGVEFELYQVVDGKVAETAFDKVSSDEEGVVYFKDLPVGDYVIKETKAKDGYYLNTDVIEFTIQDAYEGKMPVKELDPFVNYKGSITFKKTDVDGNGLVGSKFELIDSNEDVVQESISDDEGNVVFTEVEVGEYTIREVLATDGFIRNIQTVTVEVEKTAAGLPEAIVLEDFINYKGHVEFYKYDANDRPLEGAVFTVYDSEGKAVQEVSSDKKGRVYIDNLAVGEYTVKETQAPEGYLINTVEQTFVIIDLAHGLPEVIKLESVTNYKGSLMIHKVNDSGQFIAGAQFEVYDANNKLVSKFTNKSGIYHLEDLAPGRYTLVETKAPNGYRLAQKEYTFTIADSSNGVYTYDTLVVVNHLDGLPGTGIGSYMNYYMALTALGFVMVGLRVFHKKED